MTALTDSDPRVRGTAATALGAIGAEAKSAVPALRRAQKDKQTFSGVEGFSIQDASLQESMGPIQDYAKEHLVSTDKPIAMARRMLARAARELQNGIEPPALDPASQRVRAASVLLDRKINAPEWAKTALLDGLEQPVFTI